MKILVTGGAGFIGSHLVDALIERGHRVRILDSLVPQVHSNGRPEHLNPNAEFIQGDVCDAAALGRALEGIEVVYHEAAEVGVGQSMYEIRRYVRGNDLGTAALLESVIERRDRVRKLIVASSMSIYGEGAYCNRSGEVFYPKLRPNSQLAAHEWEMRSLVTGEALTPIGTTEDKPLYPTSIYAVTKQDQEQFCLITGRAYGIPTVALRYFNVYGKRQALSNPYTGVCAIFSSRLLNDQAPVIYEDGEQMRDFVHVSDIVQANLLALDTDRADYEVVNVGTGTPTSINKITGMLAEGLGKNIQPEIVGKYREGDIRHCFADIAKARDLLEYEPKVSIDQGIPELLDWVKRQNAEDRVGMAADELEARRLIR